MNKNLSASYSYTDNSKTEILNDFNNNLLRTEFKIQKHILDSFGGKPVDVNELKAFLDLKVD